MQANEQVQSLEEKTFQQGRYCMELRSFRLSRNEVYYGHSVCNRLQQIFNINYISPQYKVRKVLDGRTSIKFTKLTK